MDKKKKHLITSFQHDEILSRINEAVKRPVLAEINRTLRRNGGSFVFQEYDRPVIDFAVRCIEDGFDYDTVFSLCKVHSVRLVDGAAVAAVQAQFDAATQETFLRDEPVETLMPLLRTLLWRNVDLDTVDLPF